MTTLADINQTLREQTNAITEEQMVTQTRVTELSKSFDDFFTMVRGDAGDELEAEREQRENNVERRVRDDAQRDGKPGRFFDFDLGNLLQGGFLGGLLAKLPFRLIVTTLAAMLADEVGEQVKKMTGSDVLGNIAEWSTMGGAFGFLFGGVKGGLLGAAIGAIFSEAARDKYAEILEEQFGLSAKSAETGAMVTAAALSMATLFLPKVIPLLFGPTGLILAAVAGIGVAISKYSTDEKFRKTVNEGFVQISTYLDDIVGQIVDFIAGMVAKAKDAVIDAGKELLNTIGLNFTTDARVEEYAKARPQQAADIKSTENEMAFLVGQYGQQINSDLFVGNTPKAKADKQRYDQLKALYENQTKDRDEYFANLARIKTQKSMPNYDVFDETIIPPIESRVSPGPLYTPDEFSGDVSVSRVPQQRAIQLNDAITMDQKRAMQGVSYVDASSPTVVNNAGDSTFVSNSTPDVIDSRAALL